MFLSDGTYETTRFVCIKEHIVFKTIQLHYREGLVRGYLLVSISLNKYILRD